MKFLIDNKKTSSFRVLKALGKDEFRYICSDAKRTYQTYKLKSSKYLIGDGVLTITI